MIIKNKLQLINNTKTKEIKKLRRDILEGLEFAVAAVDPYVLIKDNLKLKNEKLEIGGKLNLDLSKFKNIYLIGAGKATFMMAKGSEIILGNKIKKGFINVPEIPKNIKLKKIKATIASHPYPNKAGVLGAKKILNLAKKARKSDLVFVLISGGGSSLMPYPASGISLEDKIAMNKLLVKSPAVIQEINCVRKHISRIKGGLLAKALYPAKVVSLYLSDVVGDDLSSIASGPCVPDKSTFLQTIRILKKYNLWSRAPKNIKKYLLKGLSDKNLETPKPQDKIFKGNNFSHFILGSNKVALFAFKKELQNRKYNCQIYTSKLQGDVYKLAKKFTEIAKKIIASNRYKKPFVLLAGGEMTLKLKGRGFGGRNQELAMAISQYLPKNVVFASFNTDGVDGRTPKSVAGGICDEWTYARSQKLGLKIKEYIKNNDSYLYLNKLNEVILTGKTGTNVGDIVIIGIV
ncbi:MAG: glycerate kinase [Patescibacteria group bacterium]